MAKTAIAILYLGIVGLYLLGLFTVLLVHGDGWLLGLAAFLLTALAHNLRKGSWLASRPFELAWVGKIGVPLCLALFLGFVASSLTFAGPAFVALSGPDVGAEPILAARDSYLFDDGSEGPRWRFVLSAALFHLAWHLFGIGIALDDWAGAVRERLGGEPGSAVAGGRLFSAGDWGRFWKMAAGARRGRFSRTHVKRIRKFVFDGLLPPPFFYVVFGITVVGMIAAAAGLVGSRAVGVPVALVFLTLWFGLALDLVLSIWEKDVLGSIWMALWVAFLGAITLTVLRWVLLGG